MAIRERISSQPVATWEDCVDSASLPRAMRLPDQFRREGRGVFGFMSSRGISISLRDVETAVAASVPVIVSPLSHCYLDVRYAEPSADPRQAERQGRLGQRVYSPKTIAEFVRLGTGRSAWARSSSARRGSRSRNLGRDDLRLRRSVLPAVASAGRRRPQALERPAGRHLDRPPGSPRSAPLTLGARRPNVLPHLHRGLALAPGR